MASSTSSQETKINNSAHDRDRDIEFIVPYHRQLSGWEIGVIVRRHIADTRNLLFDDWIAKPANRDFDGDVDTKKEELLRQRHHSKMVLLPEGAVARALVEDLAGFLLGSSESLTFQTDALAKQGYDIAELEGLFGIYNALRAEDRRFEISKDGVSAADPRRYGLNIRRKSPR